MTNELALKLVDVHRSFRVGEVTIQVLRGVDVEFRRGELTVVLGHSGSGKSTLLNIMGGLDRPSSGEVWHGDVDISKLDDRALTVYRRDHLGFVFQLYNLVPTLTAAENVQVATEGTPNPMDPREALALVGLAEMADKFPAQMSGGEQQRVAVARAVARRPALLLCDELTGALDSDTGRRILDLVVGLNDELGMTIVVITHAVPIADLAHQVVRLDSGRVVESHRNERRAKVAEIDW